jgi:hypothetical protein
MKRRNKKIIHSGAIRHIRALVRKRIPRENIFTGNGISQFADPESLLSLGL